MPDLALDLRHLKYAILVAEHGSFRRTADALNISQSTVCRRIQLLERRLGAHLFERSKSGARLTFAGERFIRDASMGAEQLQKAANDLAFAQRGNVGELRIGLVASLAAGFLSDLLCRFLAAFPNVDVMLEEASSQSNAAGVLSGRLDVAFISGDPTVSGCLTRTLWDERIVIALPSGHSLAAKQVVRWVEVRDETFLVSVDGPGQEVEDYIVRQLSDPGFRPKILVQKLGRENLLNMVAKGFGITLTTDSTIGTTYNGVTFVPIGRDDECVASSVVWSANSQNPALKKLLALSDEIAASRDGRAFQPSR